MANEFDEFDPLDFKSSKQSEAAFHALKREIRNILSSYVGWFDPFCELIQNALDAVELRYNEETGEAKKPTTYVPTVQVTIDIQNNRLTVTDNGIGLSKDQFHQFLAPHFSFKSGATRGHKGVGATYVAYGFNQLQIATKSPSFSAVGKIENARRWLDDPAPSGNPKVRPEKDKVVDDSFEKIDRGVSISVQFDETTHPKRLSWIQSSTADSWLTILSVKTGLGAIFGNSKIHAKVRVIDSTGNTTEKTSVGIGYHWLHFECAKKARFREILQIESDLFKAKGANFKHPDKINNLDIVYDAWTADELLTLLEGNLDDDEKAIIATHKPFIGVEFGYTAKLWQNFNETLGVRAGHRVQTSGIQLASNNMPQGESIQIPLKRNIGRQNQIHFVFHFDNYSPDMGRKGFHRELTDFAKEVSRKITELHLAKVRARLKANTGVAPDLLREHEIQAWKTEMQAHEKAAPLAITNKHFFLPISRISIVSVPSREQDVIALFHQVVAGGIIRGIKVMATNERLTYDGLFRISFDLDIAHYLFNEERNPLGLILDGDAIKKLQGIETEPKVLEYKFSLDGLVEDIDNGDKNAKDINLAVVWETGTLYKERYGITSLLIPENIDQRQFHGVTHHLNDLESGGKVMDLIVLSELIDYLNAAKECGERQRKKYE